MEPIMKHIAVFTEPSQFRLPFNSDEEKNRFWKNAASGGVWVVSLYLRGDDKNLGDSFALGIWTRMSTFNIFKQIYFPVIWTPQYTDLAKNSTKILQRDKPLGLWLKWVRTLARLPFCWSWSRDLDILWKSGETFLKFFFSVLQFLDYRIILIYQVTH